jgi:rSAM/selenodomain-associated transferase 1
MHAERTLIQVFAKAPVPGSVKTRLIPHIGAHGAAELYCRMLRRALATAVIARVGRIELWTTEPAESPFLQLCQRLIGVPIQMQIEGDLGARMSHALRDGLSRAGKVLLVGVDIPGMTHEDLREARNALDQGCDAVLGPAEDGGYWLIGVRRHDEHLFEDVVWSGSDVAQRTRARLQALGWRWHELATRWDVDRPEDLHRLAALPHLSELLTDLVQPA